MVSLGNLPRQIFRHMEEVEVMSACRPPYVAFLLTLCPALKRLNLGATAELDGATLAAVMAHASGACLRQLEVTTHVCSVFAVARPIYHSSLSISIITWSKF